MIELEDISPFLTKSKDVFYLTSEDLEILENYRYQLDRQVINLPPKHQHRKVLLLAESQRVVKFLNNEYEKRSNKEL